MLEGTLSLVNQEVVLFLGEKHRLFEKTTLTGTDYVDGRLVLSENVLDLSLRDKMKASVKLFKRVRDLGFKELVIVFDEEVSDLDKVQILKKLIVFNHPFDKYQSKKQEAIKINVYDMNNDLLKDASQRAEAINFARSLVNEPANYMTPTQLGEEARVWAKEHGLEVEVVEPEGIEALGMEAFLSVAKGSSEAPRLIVIRYLNNPDSDEKVALVGKGVTYDSGGLAIKPAGSMKTMHSDMGGSAAVIAAIGLLAKRQAKVNAVAIVAACENMISGCSFKNGDIIQSMSGKTIEIINTDAEGRLTLADAIYYAHKKESVTRIVDIATLTGAAIAALGNNITAVVSDDDKMFNALLEASDTTQDKVWRMPVDDELAKANDSKVADIKNATTVGAGTTTAGLFLRSFADETPWTHLDIAGPAFKSGDDFDPTGASGVGAELLAETVENFFE